jgi:hypothetical protein
MPTRGRVRSADKRVDRYQRLPYPANVSTYDELPGLEHLYLEDSFVLGVHDDADTLRFDIEAVLTEQHPRYSPPKPDEQYSYLPVALVFAAPRAVKWVERPMKPTVDATGEIDYGNIDSFTWEDDRYELSGEWGHVVIDGEPPAVIEQP